MSYEINTHIQELRAELANTTSKKERAKIQAEIEGLQKLLQNQEPWPHCG